MTMFTKIPERFRSRVVMPPQTTANAADDYLLPTPGAMGITLRCIAKIGHATDLVLSLKSSDDATGTTTAAYPVDVPIYVNGVRKADGKAYTVPKKVDADIAYIVDFCIDPATVPEGKYVGIAYAASNAANLLAVEMIEDVAYKPTAS